jgi:hypothetical protein
MMQIFLLNGNAKEKQMNKKNSFIEKSKILLEYNDEDLQYHNYEL